MNAADPRPPLANAARRAALGVLPAVCACACACGGGSEATAGAGQHASAAAPPNLVVICIDTLRADRLGCYGHARPTTPNLDRLAARGVRFERAYATAPWTLPSTGSLMTGLPPDVHRGNNFLEPISPQARLLAELAGVAGFDTAAFIGNYFVQPLFGLARGFGTYNGDCLVDRTGINSAQISDRALAWLGERGSSSRRPFFLYLHYFDPHYNYFEHAGFAFGSSDTERVWSGQDIFELREQLPQFDAADQTRLDDLYDSEVAFTDHHVGRVLARLDELKLMEGTVVVVTSDHGEALGEHGWIGHTTPLYEECLQVPLLIAGPGLAPGTWREIVQLDQILPSVSELLGLPAATPGGVGAASSALGASLAAGLRDPAARRQPGEALAAVQTTGINDAEEVAPRKRIDVGEWRLFVDTDADGKESYRIFKTDEPKGQRKKDPADHPDVVERLRRVRDDDLDARRRERERHAQMATRRRALLVEHWKLIVDEVSGEIELYDLATDPRELRNLADEQPARVGTLKARLEARVEQMVEDALPAAPALDSSEADEARKKVRAAGYIK